MPPFRSVLCAVDLSDMTASVVYHGAGLAGAEGARLDVLHVSDQPERDLDVQRAFLASRRGLATSARACSTTQRSSADGVTATVTVWSPRAARTSCSTPR